MGLDNSIHSGYSLGIWDLWYFRVSNPFAFRCNYFPGLLGSEVFVERGCWNEVCGVLAFRLVFGLLGCLHNKLFIFMVYESSVWGIHQPLAY